MLDNLNKSSFLPTPMTLGTKQDRREAKRELVEWKALRELVKCNDFGCEIHMHGMTKGLCVNKKLIPVIDHNIREIEKFLKGKPNKWE